MEYDLHVHTRFSDGQMTVSEVLDAAEQQNIGIAVMDHNEIRGSMRGLVSAERRGVPFICGFELGTREGKELLLYFINPAHLERFYHHEIEPYKTARMARVDRSMDSFLSPDLRSEYKIALVSLPHPFCALYKNIRWNPALSRRMISFCDAVEVINTQMRTSQNQQAQNAALSFKKSMTSGSDAHVISDVGKATTTVVIDNDRIIPKNCFEHGSARNPAVLYYILSSNVRYTCNEHYRYCRTTIRIGGQVVKLLTLRLVGRQSKTGLSPKR